MAISGLTARFLIAEHKYKPLPREVVLLGRQTIHVQVPHLHSLFAEEGLTMRTPPAERDLSTREGKDRAGGPEQGFISDTAFFNAFDVETLHAVDHSDFEGADIILDLSKPIPRDADDSADFIFDGSVMDNLFNPAQALSNIARMLRPGGRYFGINVAASRNAFGYTVFNPYWFFDFFVVNKFRDVKVYIYDYYEWSETRRYLDALIYAVDPDGRHEDIHRYQPSAGLVGLLIIAEKGEDSTSDRYPTQGIYRSADEWKLFHRNLDVIKQSPRPFIKLLKQAHCIPDNYPNFLYVGNADSVGRCAWNIDLVSEQRDSGSVAIGELFAGYGWELPEKWEGKSWRRIHGGRDPSVIVLNLQSHRDYRIEIEIHTARDEQEMMDLALSCAGTVLPTRLLTQPGKFSVVASLPRTLVGSGLVEIAMSMPPGTSIGLAALRYTLVR